MIMVINMLVLERDIVERARIQLENPKLTIGDIIEWGTHPISPRRGQSVVRLTTMGINIRVAARHDNCRGLAGE